MTAVLIAAHTLAAAIWVGALFYVLKALPKGMAAIGPADRVRFAAAAAPRFFAMVAVAALVLLVTGYALPAFLYGGLGATPGYVHAMAMCGWIMIGVAGAAWIGPAAILRRAARSDDPAVGAPALGKLRLYVVINAVLGSAAIVLGAGGPYFG